MTNVQKPWRFQAGVDNKSMPVFINAPVEGNPEILVVSPKLEETLAQLPKELQQELTEWAMTVMDKSDANADELATWWHEITEAWFTGKPEGASLAVVLSSLQEEQYAKLGFKKNPKDNSLATLAKDVQSWLESQDKAVNEAAAKAEAAKEQPAPAGKKVPAAEVAKEAPVDNKPAIVPVVTSPVVTRDQIDNLIKIVQTVVKTDGKLGQVQALLAEIATSNRELAATTLEQLQALQQQVNAEQPA